MALSGSFYGSGSSSGYQKLYFTWSATQSVTNNTSTITVNMYLTGSYAITIGTRTGTTITIAGSTGSFTANSVSHSSSETGWSTYLGSYSYTVGHNADGTLTTTLSGYYPVQGTFGGTYYGSFSGSSSVTLDTIPRASTPTASPTPCDIGATLTILGHRADASFTHKFYYAFGNIGKTAIKTYGSAPPYDNDATWVLPNALANQIPSSTSGTGTIYCETYNSSGSLLGTNTCSFTAHVPDTDTFHPTISTLTISENASGVSALALGGKYVQLLSNVLFQTSGINGAYGSTVSSIKVSFNGSNYVSSVSANASSWTTGAIGTHGTMNYSITCTDSRGYSVTTPKSGTITVLPYSAPLITGFTAKRCDSSGNLNELGTYLFIDRDGTASSLKDTTNAEKNTLACKVEWSLKGANSWTAMSEMAVSASSSMAISTTGIKSTKTDFAITSAYDIRFSLYDKFNNTVATQVVTVGTVVMSWGRTGVGIGKVWTQGALDVKGDIYENDAKLTDKYVQTASTNEATDLNNVWKSGFYDIYGGSNNPATGNWLWVVNLAHSSATSSYKFGGQFGIEIANGGRAWYRSKQADGTGTWQQIVSTTPRFTWSGTVPYQGSVTITHNLGYVPNVTFDGTVGNVNINWRTNGSTTSIEVNNWIASGGNSWTGTVRFY